MIPGRGIQLTGSAVQSRIFRSLENIKNNTETAMAGTDLANYFQQQMIGRGCRLHEKKNREK
jgi:hypothetical protein